jgi:hypothetical protein
VTHATVDRDALALALDPSGPIPGEPMTATTWYLATCHRCDPDFAQPFRREASRDAWAVAHVAATGHSVVISVQPSSAPAVVLQFGDRKWVWICTHCALTAARDIDPDECGGADFDTGMLALTAARAHQCRESA